MSSVDKVVAGLIFMNAIIALSLQMAMYISLKWVDRRRRRRTQCMATVAAGNGHRATCVLKAGHTGEHATTKSAFEIVGYAKTPF